MSTDNTQKPSKHLDSLTIKNFRMLEDVEIEKLGHVNLIVGKNNSGKSTVLEALALLVSGFDSSMVKKVQNSRDNLPLTQHIDLNSKLTQKEYNLSIENFLTYKKMDNVFNEEIYIGNDNKFLNIQCEDKLRFSEYEDNIAKKLDKKFQYALNDSKENEIKLNIVSNYQLCQDLDNNNYTWGRKKQDFCGYINTDPMEVQNIMQDWEDIKLTDLEDLVIKMLRIIEPNLKDFGFVANEPCIRLENISHRISLYSMGDGVSRLLQIIVKLAKIAKADNAVLLIDEFENGLHYSVQPKVWRLIFELAKRFNIQVFATTHSWDCIESFAQVAKEREDLDGVLFRMGRSVRKSDKGKVIATVYDEEDLHYITKAKMEVR